MKLVWQPVVACLRLFVISSSLVQVLALPQPSSTGQGSFSVPLTRNPAHRADGPAEYARALAKWNVEVPKPLAGFVANKGSVGDVPAINQTNDREYLSSIWIGEPAQECQLDLDTGSSDFWVMTSNTRALNSALGNRQIWRPEGSSTAARVNNTSWEITYGDGSYAYGQVWKDKLRIANITVESATIEDATYVSQSILFDESLSGVFGLAAGLPSQVVPRQPTVLDELRPLLDRDIFTTDLRYRADGLYEFGRVDSSKYIGDLHWVDLEPNATFWRFNVTGINVGGSRLWYLSQWPVIADTGTTLLLLEAGVVQLYYGAVPTAAFNETLGGWTYPCGTDLPAFRVGFDNGYHVSIPGKYLTFMEVEPGSGVCYGGLQSSLGLPFGILGDVFLKACFAAFDLASKRIGFADKELADV